MTNFAAELRTARQSRGIRTNELARRAGIDRKTLYNYSNGRPPSVSIAKRLAEVLDWPTLADIAVNGKPETPVERLKAASFRAHKYELAIMAFCRACEPVDFVCRDSECPLRAVSPLPLRLRKPRAAA